MSLSTALLLVALLQPASVRETMERALALLQSGQVERARALFEDIVAEHPEHGPARLQLGQLAVARGDWKAALRHLEIAIRSRPHRPHLAWHLLGRARRAEEDLEGARTAFEKALELAPDFIPARGELARLSEQTGELWTALEHYRRLVELAPASAEAYAALANTARRMGATDLARCAVGRALAIEPDNASLVYLQAVIEEQAGEVEKAIDGCLRALELGFDNPSVFLTLGNLYHEQMRIAEAISAFEKAVISDPAIAESLASFALTSLTTSDYQRLRRLLERHVAAHPDSINTLYGLGALYLRENRLHAAERVFEKLRELVPHASQVPYNLAMIYRRAGREDEAAAALARFRELKQREEDEWHRNNELHKLRLRMKEETEHGRYQAVLDMGLPLVEAGRAEVEDLLLVAEALVSSAREREARSILDGALEEEPYRREALALGAEIARALGDEHSEDLFRRRLELLSPDCAP